MFTHYRAAFACSIFCIAGLLVPEAHGRDSFKIVRGKPSSEVFIIQKDDEPWMTVDMRDYEKDRIIPEGIWANELPPISPDGHYCPFFLCDYFAQGRYHFILLLADLTNKQVEQKVLIDNAGFPGLNRVDWLGPSILRMKFGPWASYIYFVDTGELREMSSSRRLALDEARQHWCFLQESLAPDPARVQDKDSTLSQRSIYLRYNDYWVYPRSMFGFLGAEAAEDYRQGRVLYDRNGIAQPVRDQYGELNARNYGLDKNYMMTPPVFVGDTTWVAFVEQVYPHGDADKILETNLVLLDASAVKENPPLPEHIKIYKRPIPPLHVARTPEEDYQRLCLELDAAWNATSGTLELRRTGVDAAIPKDAQPWRAEPIDAAKLRAGANPFAN